MVDLVFGALLGITIGALLVLLLWVDLRDMTKPKREPTPGCSYWLMAPFIAWTLIRILRHPQTPQERTPTDGTPTP